MKAVFVDGMNLMGAWPAIGIARPNYAEFYNLLTKGIGKSQEMVCNPIVTMSPTTGSNIAKYYRTAGFEVNLVATKASADDFAIISRIDNLNPAQVKEVILVSMDMDFAPVLRRKVEQGMRVYWVGCSGNSIHGFPMMSPELRSLLGPVFDFVDLLSYKERLTAKAKNLEPAVSMQPVRELKIELSGAQSADQYHEILAQLTRFLRKYPDIKYSITG